MSDTRFFFVGLVSTAIACSGVIARLATTQETSRDECGPGPSREHLGIAPESLIGEYEFVIARPMTGGQPAIVNGYATIHETDSLRRFFRYPDGSRVNPRLPAAFPVSGYMEVDLEPLHIGRLLYSPASRDPARPGIVGYSDSAGMVDAFSLGSGWLMDTSMWLTVEAASSAGFAGRWEMTNVSPRVSGYFCARRRNR